MANDDFDPILSRSLWFPQFYSLLFDLQARRPEFLFKVAGAMDRPELAVRIEALHQELERMEEARWSSIQGLLDTFIELVDQASDVAAAAVREQIEREGLPGAIINCPALGGAVWVRFDEDFQPPDDGRLIFDVYEARAVLSRDGADRDVAVAFKRDHQRIVQEGPEPGK